jgi:DNA-binding beta-propeller fold protein YncE
VSQLFLVTVLVVSPQLANGETDFAGPIKVVATPDAVYVANAAVGTVTVLNAAANRVVGSTKIADQLADLAAVNPTTLVATDPSANELIFVSINAPQTPAVTQRVPLAGATRIAVAQSGEACAVTSTWRRLLSVVSIKTGTMEKFDKQNH